MITRTRHRAFIGEIGNDQKSVLADGLRFIDWEKLVKRNAKVFIKPNFTFPSYKPGITTTPELLKDLILLLKTRTDNITVGESDGGNHSFSADEAFAGHNMYEICQDLDVRLVNLSRLPSRTHRSRILGKSVSVQIPNFLIENVDLIISVPVLKVHVMTTVSLGLKNLWGCVPDTMRCLQHQNLEYKLALLGKLLQPKIVIIDGIYGLDGHGPMQGEAIKTDLLIIADNPVAADSMGARLMGFIPYKIKTIRVAEKYGLGTSQIENIETSKEWERLVRSFHINKTIVDQASGILFKSDGLAKLVMDSRLTPVFYKIAQLLKTSDEKELARQICKDRKIGPY